MTVWRRLTFRVSRSALEDLITGLHEAGTLGAELLGDRLAAYFAEPLDEPALLLSLKSLIDADGAEFSLESSETVPDGFWHERWMESLVPFPIGDSFLVVPGPSTPPSGGRRVIRLTPGRAFGTGEHDTTRMCLTMIENEIAVSDALLDVGTGSGILAIGARLLGAGTVVAIDTDPVAIATAARNAQINDVGAILFVAGGVDALRALRRFELVVANITGSALMRLMTSLCALSSRTMILSGILSDEEDDVERAAHANGFSLIRRQGGEWVALTLRRDRS